MEVKDTGVKTKSDALRGLTAAVAVSGGIASVEVVKIIRELRRHGASVTAFMSPSAEAFITALSLEWASGKPVIRGSEGEAAHLHAFDFTLVAPATLNTLTKSALGISDTAVTLLIASQLGGKKPLFFVPTMNLQLAQHPAYPEHRAKLESWGARFIESVPEEGRLKMPEPVALVTEVIRLLKVNA